MQRNISNKVFLLQNVSPFDNTRESDAIDRTAWNYNEAKEKVQKIRELIKTGNYDADIAKYIPGVLGIKFQGMLEDIDTRKKVAYPSYKDMEELDFQIFLTDKYYVSPSNIHLCFPMKIKKSSNEVSDIDDDLIKVNNFFAHSIKETSIAKYGSAKELIPMFCPYEIYQYSDSMLKHPKDALKKLEKTLLYSKRGVYHNEATIDRKIHGRSGFTTTGLATTQIATYTKNNVKDLNIDEQISKFKDQLKNRYLHRTPLTYFTDLGKINFPLKMDFRIKCHLSKKKKKKKWKN